MTADFALLAIVFGAGMAVEVFRSQIWTWVKGLFSKAETAAVSAVAKPTTPAASTPAPTDTTPPASK